MNILSITARVGVWQCLVTLDVQAIAVYDNCVSKIGSTDTTTPVLPMENPTYSSSPPITVSPVGHVSQGTYRDFDNPLYGDAKQSSGVSQYEEPVVSSNLYSSLDVETSAMMGELGTDPHVYEAAENTMSYCNSPERTQTVWK